MSRLLKQGRLLLVSTMLVLAVTLIAGVLACSKLPELIQGSSGNAVFIKITEGGISSDASEVVIRNYYPGARAEMTYRIHNATSVTVTPEIYYNTSADIADYSKADGATKAPDTAINWLEVPQLTDIPPGQIMDFIVTLVIPKDASKPANKFGFQVGVANKTEAKLQPAVGVWWIVNMR